MMKNLDDDVTKNAVAHLKSPNLYTIEDGKLLHFSNEVLGNFGDEVTLHHFYLFILFYHYVFKYNSFLLIKFQKIKWLLNVHDSNENGKKINS